MPQLPDEQALLIACRAMNPFVNEPLLQKDAAGVVKPRAGAAAVVINLVLHEMDENDRDFGMQALDFVVQTLIALCKRAGFNLGMGPNELLDSQVIETIQDLADNLVASCVPRP
jgi:hypothetical protein